MTFRSRSPFRNQSIYLLAGTAILALFVFPPSARAQPVVSTREGHVSGTVTADGSVEAFKGIPYASPPTGALRWQPPQPPSAWQGVRKADHFSPACTQAIRGEHLPWTREFMAQYPISEDCLYLNVWTAAKRPGTLRPVLVWIHGGGLVEGSAAPAIYDGEQLARQGIVVVSINYRLGVLGFLAHPELTRESPHHASGDYGLEDIVAALDWVHQNIAAFGGDPGRVTIAGQSSGAAAVIYMSASPLAKGLFEGAIAESGAYLSPPTTTTLAAAEEQGTKFATSLGVHSVEQLRALPAADLVAAQQKTRFRPDVDGWFLPDTIQAIFAADRQNDVPTITGMNADEGSASSKYGKMTPAVFAQQASERYGDKAAEFLKLYPAATPAEASLAQKASARDDGRVAMYLWGANRAKTAKTPAYTYFFDHVIPWPEHPEFGAFHSAEIPYWFGNLDKLNRPYTPADRQLSREMSAYWLNFIRTGNPNGKGLPNWPAYQNDDQTTMQLGERLGVMPVAGGEAFSFWQKLDQQTEK